MIYNVKKHWAKSSKVLILVLDRLSLPFTVLCGTGNPTVVTAFHAGCFLLKPPSGSNIQSPWLFKPKINTDI